jgi:hypothetical protein
VEAYHPQLQGADTTSRLRGSNIGETALTCQGKVFRVKNFGLEMTRGRSEDAEDTKVKSKSLVRVRDYISTADKGAHTDSVNGQRIATTS